MMQGFGVNTYTLTNANGKRVFVKFHMIPELGVHSLVWDEALKIGGQDPGTNLTNFVPVGFTLKFFFPFRLPSKRLGRSY
jgi:catalase